MQISVSVEPFLSGDPVVLDAYLAEIVRLHQSLPGLSVHFDYFIPNPTMLALVEKYAQQIDVYAHLMSLDLSNAGFKAVSRDVTTVSAIKQPTDGIVFDLGMHLDGYENLVRQTKYITIMSVKCGKSGQVFNPEALQLVPKIRALNPDAVITIDGGVNENNLSLVKNAGIDIAVMGNYAKKCYENGNLAETLNRLLRV